MFKIKIQEVKTLTVCSDDSTLQNNPIFAIRNGRVVGMFVRQKNPFRDEGLQWALCKTGTTRSAGYHNTIEEAMIASMGNGYEYVTDVQVRD